MYTYKQKHLLSQERKRKLRENATPSEILFKQKLDEHNIPHKFQKSLYAGDFFCIVDFYFTRPYFQRLAIEIDGGYHDTPEAQERDKKKNAYLARRKVNLIRIRNEDVATTDILSLLEPYRLVFKPRKTRRKPKIED